MISTRKRSRCLLAPSLSSGQSFFSFDPFSVLLNATLSMPLAQWLCRIGSRYRTVNRNLFDALLLVEVSEQQLQHRPLLICAWKLLYFPLQSYTKFHSFPFLSIVPFTSLLYCKKRKQLTTFHTCTRKHCLNWLSNFVF